MGRINQQMQQRYSPSKFLCKNTSKFAHKTPRKSPLVDNLQLLQPQPHANVGSNCFSVSLGTQSTQSQLTAVYFKLHANPLHHSCDWGELFHLVPCTPTTQKGEELRTSRDPGFSELAENLAANFMPPHRGTLTSFTLTSYSLWSLSQH